MNRRHFLKALAGAAVVALCPIPLPTTPASAIPEIDFKLTSAPVASKVHKLRCKFSMESAQNLKAAYMPPDEDLLIARMKADIARQYGIPEDNSRLIQI